jgi:hypothetical protein
MADVVRLASARVRRDLSPDAVQKTAAGRKIYSRLFCERLINIQIAVIILRPRPSHSTMTIYGGALRRDTGTRQDGRRPAKIDSGPVPAMQINRREGPGTRHVISIRYRRDPTARATVSIANHRQDGGDVRPAVTIIFEFPSRFRHARWRQGVTSTDMTRTIRFDVVIFLPSEFLLTTTFKLHPGGTESTYANSRRIRRSKLVELVEFRVVEMRRESSSASQLNNLVGIDCKLGKKRPKVVRVIVINLHCRTKTAAL